MIRKFILSLSLLLLVAAASCNTPPVSTKDVDSQLVCEDIFTFLTSVKKLQDENQFADKTAIQAQFDVVRMNFANLREGASELNTAEVQGFEEAASDLLETADSLPEDVTVSDALDQLKALIEQVVVAAENMQTSLKCIMQP